MNTPEWLKPGIYGAAIGAVIVGVVGFTWGGWVTGGTSSDRALTMAHEDVVAAMVPVCLEMARTDPERAAKMETIKAASTYQRRDALMKAGWATVPGTDAPDRDIAQACLAELQLQSLRMQQSPDIGNEETLPAMEQSSDSRDERTELERRVLAHERVLQALIAYMSRTEPRFVDHLRERFVEPMRMARHEHDYRGADDYAEEFIRAVMLLGEPRQPPVDPSKAAKRASASENDRLEGSDPHAQRDQVLVQQRNGIWHVTVNGVFRGDYHQEEHANAAAALLKLSLP